MLRASPADSNPPEPSTTPMTRWVGPLREFIGTENSGAIILLIATVASLVWANSPWADTYEQLWHTELGVELGSWDLRMDLRHWINDGLMALFFFVVGLEFRRELDMGELRERRRVATPVIAAVGGVVLPAVIYLAINAGEPSLRGWGIVMGTDTAFALGILMLAGGASPRVRTFLLTLMIVDDVVALSVIAVVYTSDLSTTALMVAIALYAVIVVLSRVGVRGGFPYLLVAVGVWLATLASGIHPTIAGVAVGVLATAYPPTRQDLRRAATVWRLFREEPTPEYARSASRTLEQAISPNERLQHRFHPWTSYVIVPLFALANAGIPVSGDDLEAAATSPITLGIIGGLVVGKLVGITGFTWLFSRKWMGGFPLTIPLPPLLGVGTVAGIGFTVSLLIADITFTGVDLENAKLGILAASVIASLLTWVVFRVVNHLPGRVRAAGEDRLVPPIRDLAEVVDPEVDHVIGSPDAPLVLVEYGDFECPYCGRAAPVVEELVARFGDELAVVFRHLPLVDVHEHAEMAAEAAEAAAAQGRFWEMHDALFAAQGNLDASALVERATHLGLDVDRFVADLDDRRHSLRVARDVSSAADSGAAGTPTFFINGRRHTGGLTLDALSAALQTELDGLPAGAWPSTR